MAEELREIREELEKLKHGIAKIEEQVFKLEEKYVSEKERMKLALKELKRRYPNMEFTQKDLRVLRLVGALPYTSPESDKKEIIDALANKYK